MDRWGLKNWAFGFRYKSEVLRAGNRRPLTEFGEQIYPRRWCHALASAYAQATYTRNTTLASSCPRILSSLTSSHTYRILKAFSSFTTGS
jgi:hypothetical protein